MGTNYVVKVKGAPLQLYKSDGNFERTICNNSEIQSAVLSGDEVHVTMKNGGIKIYGVDGNFKRNIC